MIIANIEEGLKLSKADPSTVSSARSRIIGTLNKPIRHNPNLSLDYCQQNKPIRHNPNLSPDYCQHRRSTEIHQLFLLQDLVSLGL